MNSGDAVRFEINHNGSRVCIAGVEDFGIVHIMLAYSRRDPAKFNPNSKHVSTLKEWSEPELRVNIGGLADRAKESPTSSEFLRWDWRDLRVGDELTVRILPPGEFDAPEIEHLPNGDQPPQN